jgi:hypothetical protein
VYLRHFKLEQAFYKSRMGAGDKYLGPACGFLDLYNINFNPVPVTERLVRNALP